MQRNMDLVRAILIKIESNPSGSAFRDFGIQGFPPEQIEYHDHIMMQEGLIERANDSTMHSATRSLTWKGHEFLDLARDQDRWNRAKAIIAKVGGGPISLWMKVLNELMLQGVDTALTKNV